MSEMFGGIRYFLAAISIASGIRFIMDSSGHNQLEKGISQSFAAMAFFLAIFFLTGKWRP